MLTALSIKDDESKNFFVKIFKKIIGDKITVTRYMSVRGVCFRSIVYHKRRKNINWNRIEKLTGNETGSLMCCYPDLPLQKGFKAMDICEYKSRLCTNLILHALSKAENTENLKIALYDPNGNFSDLLPYLTELTDHLTVITKEVEYYAQIAQCIIEQTGACTLISKNDDMLSSYDIIIAPEKVGKRIITSQNSILITNEKPQYPTSAQTYYNYYFKLPKDLEKVKPEGIDNVYFAGALYIKGKMYTLGSIVPTMCSNLTRSHTTSSLISEINNLCIKP